MIQVAAAIVEQHRMASKVVLKDDFTSIRSICGMDVSNLRFDPSQKIFGAAVVLSTETKKVLESSCATLVQSFPYIPGLLAFREAPVLVEAFMRLTHKPDLIMVDGQGISHPRALGIASHIGVLLNIPTIGVAKTLLTGKPAFELGIEAGSMVPLLHRGKTVAMLLRTKRNTNPLIISIGHRVSLETAVSCVQKMLTGYRLPESTRLAHIMANDYRRQCQLLT
jgi:deoxyribonuclease V